MRKTGGRVMGLLFGLVLAACGADENFSSGQNPAAAPEASFTGVHVDTTADNWLRDQFDSVKACAGLDRGTFEDLTVVVMPPNFPCPHYPSGCGGEFVPPRTIKIGSLWIFRHEVIHYLLDQNTGNADPAHQSELFTKCF